MRENEISGADFHSPVVITLEMAVEALDYAVQLRGEDYVYPEEWRDENNLGGCQYVVNGKPACIVGVALDYLGVALQDQNGAAHSLPDIWGLDVVDYEHFRVGDLLWQAQVVQDSGETWGEAVADAKAAAGVTK